MKGTFIIHLRVDEKCTGDRKKATLQGQLHWMLDIQTMMGVEKRKERYNLADFCGEIMRGSL